MVTRVKRRSKSKAGTEPGVEPETKKHLEEELGSIHTVPIGVALILVAIIVVILASLAGDPGSRVTIQLTGGISVFAVAYIMAQLIERVVEPFSNSKTIGVDRRRITRLEKETKELNSNQNRSPRENDLLDLETQVLDRLRDKRVITFWGITSFLGILLCYVTVGLFGIVGVSIHPLMLSQGTIPGHTFDSIISGMIVGAGTKPLHDLISYLEKGSESSKS